MSKAKRPPTSVESTPSGIEIAFWDSVGADGLPQQRRYAVNGDRFVNVTTVLGILDKPALLDWAANLAREGQDWRDVRDEAGDRGKGAHDLILRSMLRKKTSLSDLPDDWRSWGQAAFRWLRARQPKVVEAECMVAAPSHGFAGRMDLLAVIDGTLTLVDFKTVTKWAYRKKRCSECRDGCENCEGGYVDGDLYPPYEENLLQLDLYAQAIEESGYTEPERGLVVRLGPDGEYDETFVNLQPERGLGILRAYRCKAAASSELRDARQREAVPA